MKLELEKIETFLRFHRDSLEQVSVILKSYSIDLPINYSRKIGGQIYEMEAMLVYKVSPVNLKSILI